MQLANATVVLTGASCGIGRATAHQFARQRANLVLVARREGALQDVVEECRQLGGRALAVVADVGDASALRGVAQAAAECFGGRIDIWINNAGVGAVGKFHEIPIEAHEQVLRTNLLGYLHGAHAVLPYFLQQESGVLINVNSEGGWVPAPYAVSYAASKFGLRGFSEALRGELLDTPTIQVCDVFPAFIDTPAFRHAGNYTGRELQPMPPVYDPYQVANAIVDVAHSPRPAVTVGRAATVARAAHALSPGLLRWGMKRFTDRYLARARRAPLSSGNLFGPPCDPATVDGGWRQRAKQSRARVAMPLVTAVAVGLLLTIRR